MTSNPAGAGTKKRALWGLTLVLAVAIAMPEELPAAPLARMTSIEPSFTRQDKPILRPFLVHCCHAHPLPPYDAYCCHSGGAVVVAPGYAYGAAGVVGTSRRVSRRTSRRVSRRR